MPNKIRVNERDKELRNIKKDIDSLRGNVVALSRTIREDVREEAAHGLDVLKDKSSSAIVKVEENVRQRPGQSMLVAFLGGVLTSALMSR